MLFGNKLKDILLHIGGIIILVILLIIGFFYLYLPATTNHGETVTVPSLEGLHYTQLEEMVTRRNLRWEVNDSAYSDKHPPLTVLRQFPPAGAKVKENRKIFLSLNRVNPPTVPVPDLIEKSSLINAEAVLKSNQLVRGKIIYSPSPFQNLVLDVLFEGTSIEEGTRIPKGSVLDLVIGDGFGKNDPYDVPDFRGMEWMDATVLLRGNSLAFGEIKLLNADTTGRTVYVIRQSPEPGNKVRMGDFIDLWLGTEQNLEELNNHEEE
jgi:eukaryotic-like serine/threonine-protein kinase